MAEAKLSFSLSSSKPSAAAAAPGSKPFPTPGDGDGAGEEAAKPQFVTVFDPSQAPAPASAPKLVISPIPNSDHFLRSAKKMKNLLPNAIDDAVGDPSGETHFVLDTSSGDAPASHVPYGLTLRSSNSSTPAARDPTPPPEEERRPPTEDLMLRRFKEDMRNLPEYRGFDEYNDVPVEGFGAAVLAGYGWSEGMGIGRKSKGDTKVVQYERRGGTEGLGYKPSSSDPKKRKGGDWVVGKNKEKDKMEEEKEKKIVRIILGRHIGMKGRVLKRSDDAEIVLKLLESDEEVRLGEDMVVESGTAAEEKFLRRMKELRISKKDVKREERNRDTRREERRSRDKEARKVDDPRQGSGGSGAERREPVRWLTSHIRVRVISKDFMGGKLYLKKGQVVDVVSPTTCDISMDGSEELLQGVDQEILETALPKRGGSVLVLYGKHKGVYGSLVERNTEDETGVVKDADSHALINVRLEQIAEYTGDPSYIGY